MRLFKLLAGGTFTEVFGVVDPLSKGFAVRWMGVELGRSRATRLLFESEGEMGFVVFRALTLIPLALHELALILLALFALFKDVAGARFKGVDCAEEEGVVDADCERVRTIRFEAESENSTNWVCCFFSTRGTPVSPMLWSTRVISEMGFALKGLTDSMVSASSCAADFTVGGRFLDDVRKLKGFAAVSC